MPALDRPYGQLVALTALSGQPDRARQVLAEFEEEVPETLRSESGYRRMLGTIALADLLSADEQTADNQIVDQVIAEPAVPKDSGGNANHATQRDDGAQRRPKRKPGLVNNWFKILLFGFACLFWSGLPPKNAACQE